MLEKSLALKEVEDELAGLNPFRMMAPLRELWTLPTAWMPRADIKETDKEYILDISLPGVRKEDVKVEVKDDVMTVTGEKKQEKEEKGKTWLRRESSYGMFQRSFVLPEGLHTEDVKASCKDGVLTLTLRKPVEVKPRGVSIKID